MKTTQHTEPNRVRHGVSATHVRALLGDNRFGDFYRFEHRLEHGVDWFWTGRTMFTVTGLRCLAGFFAADLDDEAAQILNREAEALQVEIDRASQPTPPPSRRLPYKDDEEV